MKTLRVVKPGLRTTVEDLGRNRVAIWGVPRGGAFDAQALQAANLLVGNDAGAAGLEITLKAPELLAEADLFVAYVGVETGLVVAANGSEAAVERGRAVRVPKGATLRGGFTVSGARGWLAVAGGVQVAPVLGSRSTEAGSRFGGFAGRALAAGDVLEIGNPLWDPLAAPYHDPLADLDAPSTLRVLPGPHLPAGGFREALEAALFAVARDSDRIGVRFERVEGPELPAGAPGEVEPEGTVAGAVQLPREGTPIVLGVDGPTTGGYPKPAVVIRADLGIVARLAPGMRVRFRFVTAEEARRASDKRHAALAELQW
jgi:antagonist of KipI